MAPSTQHIDDLLEWVPGPSAAASVNVLSAFAWGARRAAQSRSLLALLWVGYFLIGAGGGGVALAILRFPATIGGVFEAVLAAAGGGAAGAAPFGDTAWQALLAGSATRRLFVATPWFILFYGVLAGGVIDRLRAPRPAPLLAQLGAASGWYTGRFVRLLMLAAPLAWLLARILGPAMDSGESGTTQAVLLVLCSIPAAAIFDYARIRALVRDSRSMVLELARAARFFVRNLPRLIVLELLIAVLGAAAGLAASALASAAAQLLPASVAAAMATQLLIVALLWLRLAAWGAMLSLHQGLTLRRLKDSG